MIDCYILFVEMKLWNYKYYNYKLSISIKVSNTLYILFLLHWFLCFVCRNEIMQWKWKLRKLWKWNYYYKYYYYKLLLLQLKY